jgi:hypothetical protein
MDYKTLKVHLSDMKLWTYIFFEYIFCVFKNVNYLLKFL